MIEISDTSTSLAICLILVAIAIVYLAIDVLRSHRKIDKLELLLKNRSTFSIKNDIKHGDNSNECKK